MSTNASLGRINSAHIEYIKTIYVAGPFIGKTPWHTHLNAGAGELVAAKLWAEGGEGVFVISTHQNSRQMVGVAGERTFVVGYLRAVDISDALLVREGWEASKGTKGEILRAFEMRKPIFFETDEALSWVNGDDAYAPGSCGVCGHIYDSTHLAYPQPYSICDSCLAKAWDNARYRPDYIGSYLENKDFI